MLLVKISIYYEHDLVMIEVNKSLYEVDDGLKGVCESIIYTKDKDLNNLVLQAIEKKLELYKLEMKPPNVSKLKFKIVKVPFDVKAINNSLDKGDGTLKEMKKSMRAWGMFGTSHVTGIIWEM